MPNITVELRQNWGRFRLLFPLILWLFSVALGIAQSPPATVHFHGKTLFEIKTPTSDLLPHEAALLVSGRLDRLVADRAFDLAAIRIENTPSGSLILAGPTVLILVTDPEAAAHQQDRATLAASWARQIREVIEARRATTSFRFWLDVSLLLLLYTSLFALALWVLYWLQRKARRTADWYTQQHLAARGSRVLTLFSAETLFDAVANVLSVAHWVITLVLFNFYLNYAIRLFPGTAEISQTLGSYLLSPLYQLGAALIAYLPHLFFVLFVVLLANYLIRLSNYVFIKIARGSILVEGFYPDWAVPTAKLVRLLIIVLGAIVAFPYLPGSSSPAFQGISIFIGVLFSLGSSSTISNIISGVILTYTRAFQIGDRVKFADTVGDVVEKNLLVTRLRTIRNELVTIPNSQIMASQILNYSSLAREGKLILYTAITIGYDAPWRQVHELLLSAAAATDDVQSSPAPFVWQRALNDFNVTYELNVYTTEALRMVDIYSRLHANIQEAFNNAGVEIMSPAYHAIRDGNTVTIPPAQRPSGYETPGFRIAPNA